MAKNVKDNKQGKSGPKKKKEPQKDSSEKPVKEAKPIKEKKETKKAAKSVKEKKETKKAAKSAKEKKETKKAAKPAKEKKETKKAAKPAKEKKETKKAAKSAKEKKETKKAAKPVKEKKTKEKKETKKDKATKTKETKQGKKKTKETKVEKSNKSATEIIVSSSHKKTQEMTSTSSLLPQVEKGILEDTKSKNKKGKRSKKVTLEEAILGYADSAILPFKLEHVIESIKDTLKKPPRNLEKAISQALDKEPILFWDEKKKHYVPSQEFFQGAKFRILPREEEIKQGILIPGHRFIPFIGPDTLPFEVTMNFEGIKSKVKTKSATFPIEDLLIYHSLFGKMNMIQYFVINTEENIEKMNMGDPIESKITISVFNMKNIYKAYNFKEGDSFILTVEDWKKGIYTVEHSPRAELDEKYCNKWCITLDNALEKVFDKFGTLTEVYEQLSEAFFLGGNKLIKKAGLHIGGYLQQSKSVDLSHSEMHTILWYKGANLENDILHQPRLYDFGMTGRMDSLGAILEDISSSVTEEELIAYMKDELYSGSKSYENILKRCIPDLDLIEFYDDVQEKEFYKLIKSLWKKIEKKYNIFTDKISGKFRAKVLALIDENREWLVEIESMAIFDDNLPQNEIFQLAQLISNFKDFAISFNDGDSIEQSPMTSNEEFESIIDRMEMMLNKLRNIISDKIYSHDIPEVLEIKEHKKKKRNKKDEKKIFQLKIQLADTNIWRRVLIKGKTTVEELHNIIQDAMGWEACHLYSFYIHGIEYGEEDPYGDIATMFKERISGDSSEYICHLVEAKDTFDYEYDFGDCWEHEITVEKVIDPKKGQKYPICIGGEMACPPEDCGGVMGYQELLDIISDPDDPEYEEIIEWLGKEFRPDKFDMKEVNKRLK